MARHSHIFVKRGQELQELSIGILWLIEEILEDFARSPRAFVGQVGLSSSEGCESDGA